MWPDEKGSPIIPNLKSADYYVDNVDSRPYKNWSLEQQINCLVCSL